jgi:hypothetical protein
MQARGEDVDENLIGVLRNGDREFLAGRRGIEVGDDGCAHGRFSLALDVSDEWYHELN